MSDPRKKGGKDDKTKKGETRFVKVLELCVCRTKLHLRVNSSMKSLLQKKSLTQQKVPLKMVLFVILVYLCFDNSSIPISEKCTRSTLQRKLVFVAFFPWYYLRRCLERSLSLFFPRILAGNRGYFFPYCWCCCFFNKFVHIPR